MKRLFYNCRVITMDSRLPEAEAVMINNGKILRAGSSEELLSAAGRAVEKYDLGGRTVLPGLTDSHTHLYLYACEKGWIDLSGARSAADIISAVAGHMDNNVGDWILGRGWDQNTMNHPALPSLESMDMAAGDTPVFLERICGHAALVNSAALSRAGLERGGPDPAGGRVIWENGLVQDEAVDIIRSAIDTPSGAARKELLAAAAEEMLSLGITGVHDMGMTADALESYAELAAGGDLRLRVAGYLPGTPGDPEGIAGQVRDAARRKNDFLSVPGVKLFADGSLGARTAALIEDYSDDPGNRGITVTGRGELRRRVEFFHSRSVQTAVHAIGDLANRTALDVFEQVFGQFPGRRLRHRIEHAQVIDPVDIPR
ncbi:MAG: amidohydrolase, partial [Candidatus Krumholzibacteriota bacterium]